MAEVMGTGSLEEELRRQQREAEEKAKREAEQAQAEAEKAAAEAEAASAASAKAAQDAAEQNQKAAQEAQANAEAAAEGAKVEIGPTNRPFTEDQSFLLHQRKAVRETDTDIIKVGQLDRLPENLEPHREMLEERNRQGKIIPSDANDWGTNRIDINFRSIKDNDQAAYFATTLASDSDKLSFFKEYASSSGQSYDSVLGYAEDLLGTRLFASPQTTAGKNKQIMKGLTGYELIGYDANAIDMNSASAAEVMRAIRAEPDDVIRADLADWFEKATKQEGNRFYGVSFDKTQLKKFQSTAALTSDMYDEFVGFTENAFDPTPGREAENEQTYQGLLSDIENGGYTDYQKYHLRRAVDRAYLNQMGHAYEGSSVSGGVQPVSATDEFATSEVTSEGGAKKGTFGRWIDNVMGGGKEKQPPAPDTTPGFGSYWKEGFNAEIPQAEESQVPAAGTINLVDDPVRAVQYVKDHKGNLLDGPTRDAVNALVGSSPAAKVILGLDYTDSQALYEQAADDPFALAKANQARSDYFTGNISGVVGSTLGGYLTRSKDKNFPFDLKDDAEGAILQVALEAERAYEMGEFVYDRENENMYEAYCKQNPQALVTVQGVFRTVDEMRKEQRRLAMLSADKDQKDAAELLKQSQLALQTENFTQADIDRVAENAPVVTKQNAMQDGFYRETFSRIALDRTLSDGEEGGWYNDQTVDYLMRMGLKPDLTTVVAMQYKDTLQGFVEDELLKDYRVAMGLGYDNLDVYYGKQGGFNMDSLYARASNAMQDFGSSVTQEEIEDVKSLYKGTGEGIAWGEDALAGSVHGLTSVAADALESFWMQDRAAVDGRADAVANTRNDYMKRYNYAIASYMCEQDWRNYLATGAYPSEEYKQYVETYLNSGEDVFQLGPVPNSSEVLLQGAVRFDKAAQKTGEWAQQFLNEEQGKVFEVSSTTMSNVALQTMASALTGATGSGLFGTFATFGMMSAYPNEVREQLNKGKNLSEANAMGAVHAVTTAVAEAATSNELTSKIMRATGLMSLAQNGMSNIGSVGATKSVWGMAKLFGKNFGKGALEMAGGELVSDELKDRWLWQMAGGATEAGFDGANLLEAVTAGLSNVDIGGTISDVVKEIPEGLIYMSPMIVMGGLGEGFTATRRAAQELAATGSAESAKKFVDALNAEVQGPQQKAEINNAAKEVQKGQMAAGILMTDQEIKPTVEAAQVTQEQADSHQAEAQASQARMDTAQKTYYERKAAGDIDSANSALQEYTKAKQGLNEHTREAEQKQVEADRLMTTAVAQAMDKAGAEVEYRNHAQQEAMAEEREVQRETGNVAAVEAETFIEENYPNASEEDKQAIRDQFASAPRTAETQGPQQDESRALRNAVQFASLIKRRFGVDVQFTDGLEGGALGKFANGRIYVDKKLATQGEVIKRTMVHELTHSAEKSNWYSDLRDALLDIGYGGDKDKLNADIAARMRVYSNHAKKVGSDYAYTPTDIEQEIVADLAGKLFTENEEIINRLVAEKPSLARRIMETISSFVNKMRGVNDPELNKIRKAADLMRKALDDSQQSQTNSSGQYAVREVQTAAVSPTTGDELVGTMGGDTAVQYSLASWTPEERQTVSDNLIAKGHKAADVHRWIDDLDSVARVIAADKDRLDFVPAENHVMLKPNQEYVKTLDASTLCAKRLLYQGTFNAIQHAMPDKVLTSDDLIRLRNMMAEHGHETPCGICYVESRRRNLGTFAQQWLEGYDPKGGYQPHLDDVTTTDGLERMRLEHPEVYDSFVSEMNRKGSNNPKVVQLRTDYRGDIRNLTPKQVEKIVEIGGLRVQSFSDFETPHLLDMMQAVLDMADKGLTSQAYTKVPNFAAVFGDTGIKINLSLIAEGTGLDADGNLAFSSYEGMDFDRAMELRDMYPENVGTILVGLSDDHIKAAMADPRIDYIIPFHKSGWGQKQLEALTAMRGYEDYTADQNEKRVAGETKGGKPIYKNVKENFHPVEYWDYDKSGKENAETYLRMCAEDGRIPKFSQFLTDNGDGSYSMPADGSADGYWKLLIDYKMYDNDGNGAPQEPVMPLFNMEEAMRVLAEYEGGANELPVAQDVVDLFVKEFDSKQEARARFSLPEEANVQMTPTEMPPADTYKDGKHIDRNRAIQDGMENVKAKNSRFNTANRFFVENQVVGRPIQVTPASLRHSLTGTLARRTRNAGLASVIGDVVETAVPVLELDAREGAKRAYAMLGVMQDDSMVYPVRLNIVETDEDMGEITGIEAFDGINKQYLYSANASEGIKKGPGGVMPRGSGASSNTLTGPEISIADLWEMVKEHFSEDLSFDGKFSLPSAEVLGQEISAWRADRALDARNHLDIPDSSQEQAYRDGERQFATQTAQQSQAMPTWLKQELLSNPSQRYYDRDTNDAQLMRAWSRIQRDGYEGARDRLLATEQFTTEDVAEANVIMAMAFRDGDTNTALEMAHKYNTEGTKEGQTLQARKLFSRMTPTGIRQWASGQAESRLAERMRNGRRQRRRIDARAQRVIDRIRNLQDGDELLRLNAAGDFTIDASNSRWGVPINEQQRALIDQYHLNNVSRPGLFYNRATLRQRMLEAILATPNPLELTGNGLNLIQRLEYMQDGEAVITNADLDYIGSQLTIFASSPIDDQEGRVGDLALSRAYEAYGNITPASMREKARTWRYTSMLLSVPSALRNVIGNMGQNALNAVADGVATELDHLVSLVTGERTKAHLSARERAEGWQAFVEETHNTFRDFFVDRSITHHGEDRHNLNQCGRVYQNQMAESMRLIEGYLMSVGDRNFWRKAYVNSMSEQMRVAELNGEELDWDAAREIAEAEANYSTFSEDSAVRSLLAQAKQIPIVGDVLDFIIPFTGVPTNIVKRMWQFSPAGLATSAITHAYRGLSGQDFDQRAFVNSMARGLTGTAMFAIGMALGKAGWIELGTGDEDNQKVYGVKTAQGKQYSPFIRVGDEYVNLSPFAPAASALIMGATADALFKEDDDRWQALYNASLAGLDQIFDASYMSSLQDIFTSYGSPAENIGTTVLNSAVSQNVPAILGQLATAMDPYVRDTKDKNAVLQALKAGLVQKIPGMREMLPEKVDIAGRSVESKEGLRNFFDPMTTSKVIEDPALDEMMRLYEATGEASHMPSDALSGTKTTLPNVPYAVEGRDKEAYKKRYGELWRNGGKTYDKHGKRVTIQGVNDLMKSWSYKRMDDAGKAKKLANIMKLAKAGASYEIKMAIEKQLKEEE